METFIPSHWERTQTSGRVRVERRTDSYLQPPVVPDLWLDSTNPSIVKIDDVSGKFRPTGEW